MAEPSVAPAGKDVLESLVELVDVVTDWSLIVLVVLIVFRKEIGAHVSDLVKEVIKLISRLQSAKVGGTSLQFTPGELQSLAAENDPELLRRIFLRTPEDVEPVDVDETVAEEGESEADEIAAILAKIRSQQVRESDP